MRLIYDALNILGWKLDWSGLPLVMEMLGLDNLEATIRLMRYAIQQETEQNRAK